MREQLVRGKGVVTRYLISENDIYSETSDAHETIYEKVNVVSSKLRISSEMNSYPSFQVALGDETRMFSAHNEEVRGDLIRSILDYQDHVSCLDDLIKSYRNVINNFQ